MCAYVLHREAQQPVVRSHFAFVRLAIAERSVHCSHRLLSVVVAFVFRLGAVSVFSVRRQLQHMVAFDVQWSLYRTPLYQLELQIGEIDSLERTIKRKVPAAS